MSVLNLGTLSSKLDKLSNIDMLRAAGRGISVINAAAKRLCPSNHGELRDSIFTDVRREQSKAVGICYTDKDYASYVEFGTGPNGQADHKNISPNVTPAYSQTGWIIPGDAMTRSEAEGYGLGVLEGKDGKAIGYMTNGQAAQPFMYPAFRNHSEDAIKEINEYATEAIARAIK